MTRTRTRKRRTTALALLALLLFGASTAGTVLSISSPETVERAYGYVREATQTVEGSLSDTPPQVRLGGEGGTRELDRCDGSFIEMASYRGQDTIPVFAAHNNCGGDIIHPWQRGQQVRIEGRDGLYEVVEVRDVPKREGTTKDIVGLQGELALQTCYYGVNRMKFVGLSPIG